MRIEENVVVGCPEHGYAVRTIYPGAGEPTVIGEDVVLRSGAIVYAGAAIGTPTVIGHHTQLRSRVTVGTDSQLGHNLTVERECQVGDGVRMSPGHSRRSLAEVLVDLALQRQAATSRLT